MRQESEVAIRGLLFKLTSSACPEQYDVWHKNKNIAYLRLRHGWFRVDMPFRNTIYETTEVQGDGIFDDSEREKFLSLAAKKIKERL